MSHFGPPYKKPLDKSWRQVAEDAAEERGFPRNGREADAIMLAVNRVVDHFAASFRSVAPGGRAQRGLALATEVLWGLSDKIPSKALMQKRREALALLMTERPAAKDGE